MTKKRTKKTLTDDQKFSRMQNWAKQLGFPEDTAKRMTEKYGMYGYDLMLKALMEPSNLKFSGYTSSKNALHYLLGEDKKGNPCADNVITLDDAARILNKNATQLKTEVAEFRTAHDIPTQLPEVPKIAQKNELTSTYFNQRIDATTTAAQTEVAPQMAQMSEKRVADSYTTLTHAEPEVTSLPSSEEEWINQELARMKGNNGGELSFATLHKNGLTNEDMQNALSTEMVCEVHAGSTSQKLARSARKQERSMSGSGNCLAGVQYAASDTLGICYGNYNVERLPNSYSNSACFSNQVWEQCGKFTVFKFENDRKNGNTCLNGNPPLAAGAIVNFERGKTKHGHVTISDGNGGYNCDIHQTGSRIASGYRSDGTPYGDHYYISFTNDCTVSDKLARQMLHERYLREHPDATRENNTMHVEHVEHVEQDSISNIIKKRIPDYIKRSYNER